MTLQPTQVNSPKSLLELLCHHFSGNCQGYLTLHRLNFSVSSFGFIFGSIVVVHSPGGNELNIKPAFRVIAFRLKIR